MPLKKKQKLEKKAKKRRRDDDEDLGGDDGDEFFLEDDKQAGDDEADDLDAPQETAEVKRLRLAKTYLAQLRASGVADEEGAGEDFVLDDDELAEKLRQQAQQAGGYIQRQLAERVTIPSSDAATTSGAQGAKFYRCHDLAVTSLALTHDDAVVYSVGKEGGIRKLDVETGSRTVLNKKEKKAEAEAPRSGPDWVKKGPRQASSRSLLAAAVSSDGALLAVGGGDRKVHVWDTRTESCVQSYPGHKDAITGLAFRYATHELYSASADRSIKIWSLDDRCYVDTLFGHQAEVLAVDALRQERVVSAGHDHSCRVWKVPEESQLIYRAPGMATDCCRYITGTEWITGSSDGALAIWSQLKKKPAFILRGAHCSEGGASGPEAGWILSVGVCSGSDLVVSGAGDGLVRLWHVSKGVGSNRSLQPLGGFPVKGFANSLAVASSGRFVVAGLGREQRLGRWATIKGGQTGVLIQPLQVSSGLE